MVVGYDCLGDSDREAQELERSKDFFSRLLVGVHEGEDGRWEAGECGEE